MDKTTAANELNTLLKGEQMAVEAYEKFISAVDNETIRESFQQIQGNHKENASQLAGRIQDLGREPDYSTGIAGVFSNMKLGMQTNSRDSFDILKMAYDGEDKGIAAAEEVIRGDLDDTSLELAKNILSNDHDHLKQMLRLMSDHQRQ
jgi:ferritin-like protein